MGSPLRPYRMKNRSWVFIPKSKGQPSGGFQSRSSMCYQCFPPTWPCPDILMYSGQLQMLAPVSIAEDFLRPQKRAFLACGAGRGARGLTALPRPPSPPLQNSPQPYRTQQTNTQLPPSSGEITLTHVLFTGSRGPSGIKSQVPTVQIV